MTSGTTAATVESLLRSWGVDSVLGRPLCDFVAAVLASPTLLLDMADALDLTGEQRRHARHLAGALAAGLDPETVGDGEWS